jgi:hypothetical protein
MKSLAFAFVALMPLSALAQDAAAPGADPAANTPRVKVERSASGQKIYRIEDNIVVEGRIQKPNAFYVLQRSNIDYDWETLKQDFLPKILQATTRHPF